MKNASHESTAHMIGTTIGHYRVLRKLGEGGMGAVFEAVHEAIERHVAIKILHAEYAKNAEFANRFFNEARAVNLVDHPGLVQISDYGQLPDATAYIVMEYLKGETLRSRMESLGGPMPVPDVLLLGLQMADALAAAHAKGIVHRDLKPENVMIIPDPQMHSGERTKLLDFGIAKLTDSMDPSHVKTRTQSFMGTPVYMSPEQCRGAGSVDEKSDVYSFGVLLYAMLVGKPPFNGEGVGDIIGKHLYEEPPPLKTLAPAAPQRLTKLVHSLLQKDKHQRPSMTQAFEELESLSELMPSQTRRRSGHNVDGPTIRLPKGLQAPFERLSTLGLSTGHAHVPPGGWRRRGLTLGAVCALGLVGLFGLRVLNIQRPTTVAPPPAQPAATSEKPVVAEPSHLSIQGPPPAAEVVPAASQELLEPPPAELSPPAAAVRNKSGTRKSRRVGNRAAAKAYLKKAAGSKDSVALKPSSEVPENTLVKPTHGRPKIED